jgi:hypothetical protein
VYKGPIVCATCGGEGTSRGGGGGGGDQPSLLYRQLPSAAEAQLHDRAVGAETERQALQSR